MDNDLPSPTQQTNPTMLGLLFVDRDWSPLAKMLTTNPSRLGSNRDVKMASVASLKGTDATGWWQLSENTGLSMATIEKTTGPAIDRHSAVFGLHQLAMKTNSLMLDLRESTLYESPRRPNYAAQDLASVIEYERRHTWQHLFDIQSMESKCPSACSSLNLLWPSGCSIGVIIRYLRKTRSASWSALYS